MDRVSGAFELREPGGAQAEHGAGPMGLEVDLPARTAALQIDGPAPFRLDLDDVDGVEEEGPLGITLALAGGLSLALNQLGRSRDALLRALRQAFRDHAADRLRLGEAGAPTLFEGEVEHAGVRGPAQLRVHATRLAVLPDRGAPFAQTLGAVTGVAFDEVKYALTLTSPDGDLVVGKLGASTAPFQRLVEERRSALHQRGSKALALLLPRYDSLTLRRLGALLPDSGVASAEALDAVKPGTFAALAHVAASTPALSRSIDALLRRCIPGQAALCLAETRDPGDGAPVDEDLAPTEGEGEVSPEPPNPGLEGRTVGLVFPLAGGQVLAVEVGGHAGRATYLFRAGSVPRALLADWAQLDFKREPIYLGEEKLCAGPHGSWRMALRRLPALARLRAAFLGRAAHGAGWQAALDAILDRASS